MVDKKRQRQGVSISKDVYLWIKSKGSYGESFTEILERLLKFKKPNKDEENENPPSTGSLGSDQAGD